MKAGPVIAIDGPAGAGKSSVTKRLAETLRFVHVDTGALYRAIAYLALEKNLLDAASLSTPIDAESPLATGLADLSRNTHLEFRRVSGKNPKNRIFANGEDVTNKIRTPEVSMGASLISAVPGVRSALLGLQRRLGCVGKTILEGRDIGTVVFPDADVKFFLTASIEERAKRRLSELEASGADVASYEEVLKAIRSRDESDTSRKSAPLKRAKDALEIDTTTLTLDQVVEEMAKIARARLGLK